MIGDKNSTARSKGALNGVRVVDLTRVWAGPLGTRTLGDFGAEVIKVGDPRLPGDRLGGLYTKLNRNKSSLGLRLDTEAGRRIFLDLVSVSDIIIENFRPRVMRNLDLGYEVLKRANPSIVMCAMPGFGAEGPYAEFPAFGSTAEAMSGVSSLIGYKPGRPLQSGMSYADPVSALNLVGVVMTYLRRSRVSGRGQYIDLALADSPVCMIGEYLVANSATSHVPPLRGNKHSDYSPHGAYRADGDDNWVAIAVTNDDEWQALCTVVGDDRLLDGRFSNFDGRKRAEEHIDAVISEWTAGRDAVSVMTQLQSAGVPAGRVANNQELLRDPHLAARDFFVDLDEYDSGRKRYDGQSIRGNIIDKSDWKPSPLLGQHSRNVLVNLLGYSEIDCDALASEGVTVLNDQPSSTREN
ncbi:MAG: CoA transferase [SAR202 cluster bacterium]|jgi:crotonobetainyl-CoA:carnitine CoA-transferase CaiB-like acyl-CoA transferase|nr:CoA transferase [SAR202 cluster bacterium]MDP6664021.1 CoA transferase [SAR202 cluster bacterium]MQG56467.1 CoA transferase [SAR202 cluster bacterium]MQG68919.1 CoA transferase [SAR202 cluster bacterium]|tara:strand:+ start:2598 stop:3827 length:1230 start_codon:yes stop_codon:yes gene_type:complete